MQSGILMFLADIHGCHAQPGHPARASGESVRAEGAEPGTAALPAGDKPQPQPGLGPSAPVVAMGGHPAPGGRRTPLGMGLAHKKEKKLRLFPLSRLGSRTTVPGLPVPRMCHRQCKHSGMLSPPVCPPVGAQSRCR